MFKYIIEELNFLKTSAEICITNTIYNIILKLGFILDDNSILKFLENFMENHCCRFYQSLKNDKAILTKYYNLLCIYTSMLFVI